MASLGDVAKWQWLGGGEGRAGRRRLYDSLGTLCLCMAEQGSVQDGFMLLLLQVLGNSLEQICILCGTQIYNNANKLKQQIKIKMMMSKPELKLN